MLALSLNDNKDLKKQIANQSEEAIKALIVAAEKCRHSKQAKSVDFITSYFKQAKSYLI